MIKRILILLMILITLCSVVYAGNNTESILYPTMYLSSEDTVQVLEGGDSNLSFSEGYKGYCAEWGEHSAEEGQEFVLENTDRIDNSNYLKTMFLFFYNQTQKDVYATQHMVWKFTDDKQFSRFNQSWYNQIIETGDKYTIPDAGKIKLNDTHQFSFDFKALIPFVNEFQTFFGYQFLIEEIPDNSTIEINNSTTNNSTIIIPEYENNNTEIQFNETVILEEEKVKDTSTSDTPNMLGVNKKTGISLWMIGCLIILGMLIFVLKD